MTAKINDKGTLEIKVETEEERLKLRHWYESNIMFNNTNVDIFINFDPR